MKPLADPILVAQSIVVDLDQYHAELKDVWDSGWFTNNGGKHRALESLLAKEVFQTPHVSLVSNATLGLLTALKMFHLKGEVITTPFTFPATPHAITWAGLEPVFCDIDPESLTIDPTEIEKKITKSTSAILGVHVFGRPCEVHAIERIAKQHDLQVIYDAAHAFELEVNGKSVASFGDASVFSFHATKLFHTAEGGAVAFQNPENKKQFDLLKNFGIENEGVYDCGLNFKMNELQAALGLVVMKARLNERCAREKLREIYRRELADVGGLSFISNDPDVNKESLQYCAIRISKDPFGSSRDQVWERLKTLNVYARRYFYPLCSDYPHYQAKNQINELPQASKVVQEILCLPFHSGVNEEQAVYICKAIKSLNR
jgi:dTDP-4-amino-4,6-dideoxygalactose transaminase